MSNSTKRPSTKLLTGANKKPCVGDPDDEYVLLYFDYLFVTFVDYFRLAVLI